jgi:hypothetical protein
MGNDDEKTLPKAHLDRKRGGESNGRISRVAFSPRDIEQIEKLAGIGLNEEQISWVIGVSESTLQRHIRKERDLYEKGKLKGPSVYVAIRKGRSSGDAQLAKTLYEMAIGRPGIPANPKTETPAIPAIPPNPSILMFLARTRLKWEPTQEVNMNNKTVIFETQMGKDGVIRQQELEEERDGAKVIEMPVAGKGSR